LESAWVPWETIQSLMFGRKEGSRFKPKKEGVRDTKGKTVFKWGTAWGTDNVRVQAQIKTKKDKLRCKKEKKGNC